MANLSVSLLNMTKAIELKISVRGLKPNQKDQITDLMNQLPQRLSKKKKQMYLVIKMLKSFYELENSREKLRELPNQDDELTQSFLNVKVQGSEAEIIAEFNMLKKMK